MLTSPIAAAATRQELIEEVRRVARESGCELSEAAEAVAKTIWGDRFRLSALWAALGPEMVARIALTP